LLSRLNNKETGKILIVQQRLADNDLPGYLREKGNFHILSLPVMASVDEKISLGRGRFHFRKADTMLFPQRDSREVIERLRKEMGETAFSAQYLQNPSPPGGNRIRMSWFGTYEPKYERNWYQKIVQSWDTAMSAEPTSDYSVCMTWGYREMRWYLVDVHREKHDFPELVDRAHALNRAWTPDMIIIEDGATGKPLFQELQRGNLLHKICLMRPIASKDIRLEAQTIKLQNETFFLPKEAPWLQALKNELQSYPNGRYNDQVDSLTQFLASLDRPRSYRLLKLGRKDGFSVPLPKRRRLRPKVG
jgi:predicted phage terminase large subunit-like protein